MDGISVAAAVIGLLGAAAKITLGLNEIIARVKDAPKVMERILREVKDMNICLVQIRSLLLEAINADGSNRELLMVENINVVLSDCVMAFSELEELVARLELDSPTKTLNLFKWMQIEKRFETSIVHLEVQKFP